jgi:hypothetical protein
MRFRSLAAVLGILAVVSCARAPVRTGAFPAGPGLLEGRPAQATGLLPDVPWNRNAILVRAVGYQSERRTFERKTRFGTWVCPVGDCKVTFTDTLNFWLHQHR